jgi:hypothetical protein
LAIRQPEQVKSIIVNKNDHNIYFKGLASGKEEYEMEKMRDRHKSMNQNDAHSNDRDKEKN